jgi:hypothetical protein
MGERFNLPPGCAGFTSVDGSRISAKAGTSVVLEDHHAARLKKSAHASIGLVTPMSYALGTKKSTLCPACNFLGQAWTTECPRCQTVMLREDSHGGSSDEEASLPVMEDQRSALNMQASSS